MSALLLLAKQQPSADLPTHRGFVILRLFVLGIIVATAVRLLLLLGLQAERPLREGLFFVPAIREVNERHDPRCLQMQTRRRLQINLYRGTARPSKHSMHVANFCQWMPTSFSTDYWLVTGLNER